MQLGTHEESQNVLRPANLRNEYGSMEWICDHILGLVIDGTRWLVC